MRSLLALCLIACTFGLVGLTGCNLPKRLKGGSGGTNQPFVGAPSSDPVQTPTTDDNNTLASKASVKAGKGYFAGEVIDRARRRVPNATIRITEIDSKDAVAPLSIATDKGGYFDVSALDDGRLYKLSARKRDGNRWLTGSVRVRCSNVHVIIPLTGEEPVTPGDREDKPSKEEAKASQTSPGAALAGPIRAIDVPPPQPEDKGHVPPPPPPPENDGGVPPLTQPANTKGEVDPSLLGKNKGFLTEAPSVNVPGPNDKRKPNVDKLPPPPPMSGEGKLKQSSAPSAVPSTADDEPARVDEDRLSKVVVPSCVMVGKQVKNLALYDYDGNVWELNKKRRGRLMLIQFSFSTCPPCKTLIPWLTKLNADYRDYGLDVVSVAHEKGTPVEKQDAVRAIRKKVNYPILFTGGSNGEECPVLRQFQIQEYPTLILLDRDGKVLWRGNGLNENTQYQLTMYVRRLLGMR